MSALAGTIAAPLAARRDAPGAAAWLRSAFSLALALGILAIALPVAFGSVGGAQGGGDPLRVFSSGSLAVPQVSGATQLSVAGMVPGQGRSAVVRVANPGNQAVALSLTPELVDRPAQAGASLADSLNLRIASAGGAVLYSGPIGQAPDLRLGDLAAGAQRAFRFTVTLADTAGNGVEGSSLSAGFAWNAS